MQPKKQTKRLPLESRLNLEQLACPCCLTLIAPEGRHLFQKNYLLWLVLILVSGFSLVELSVGHLSHSLSLLADSGHMVFDSLALVIALIATYLIRYVSLAHRRRQLEALSALVNGLGLVGMAGWIASEALARWRIPSDEILSIPMFVTALIGLGINGLNLMLLKRSGQMDLNLRGAFLHVLADAINSLGVMAAAIVVWILHWGWADGVMSLMVAGLIGLTALPLLAQSLNTLYADASQPEPIVASSSRLSDSGAMHDFALSGQAYCLLPSSKVAQQLSQVSGALPQAVVDC